MGASPSSSSSSVRYRICKAMGTEDPNRPIVIYAPGKDETFDHAALKCDRLAKLYAADFCAFEYPTDAWLAYSESEKYEAIDAVYAALTETHGRTCVYVWGRSLGASVAAHLASARHLKGVVLEAPLASVMMYLSTQYVSKQHPYVRAAIMSGLAPLFDAFSTVDSAREGFHGAPTFIVTLGNDTVVPGEHAEMIADALRVGHTGRVYMRRIEGKDHNDPIDLVEYGSAVPEDLFYPDSISPAELLDLNVGMER